MCNGEQNKLDSNCKLKKCTETYTLNYLKNKIHTGNARIIQKLKLLGRKR